MGARLLLWLYPRRFREEYRGDLLRHMERERTEPRYGSPLLGPVRFWWDASLDAIATGIALRSGELRDGWRRVSRRKRGHEPLAARDDDGSEQGGVGMMIDAILRDFRHAFRGLRKTPGYALVFVLTLGLGIGVNTAMFSAVDGVLLSPLPHQDGDRLVYLRHSAQLAGMDNVLFSVPEIDDYRAQTPSFEAVAEFSALTFTMLGYENPRRVRAGIVTGNYFGVMGLSARLGRTIGPEDDGETAPGAIVLSDAYWRRVFGGDPAVVGRTVEINARTATIVGVAEPAPPYPERTDVYVNMAASPHHLEATMNTDRIHRMTEVFARLAPGASIESARTEVGTITQRLHGEYPEAYDAGAGFAVSLTPLKAQLTSRARPTLLLLLGTAFFVLVIACANLANLTLTRVIRREHELAIRVSLGGSRGALRRELLAESLILSAAGAALGLLMATVSLDLLIAFAERFTSRASEITLDPSVFTFALAAGAAASAVFTLVPRLPDSDDVSGALTRSGTRSTVSSGGRRAQRALVVAQIGTSFVLLIGAGLLLRTMIHLTRTDPGFDTEQVLSMDVPSTFGLRPEGELRDMYLSMLRDFAAVPGVQSVALTSSVPFRGGGVFTPFMEIDVEGHEPSPGAPTPRAELRSVSAGYFATTGIEVLRGREFVSTDVEDAQPVVIINESLARAYFGDRNPVGARIAWTDDLLRFIGMNEDWRTVVGVVADTRDWGLDEDIVHTIYNPYHQVTPYFANSFVLRVDTDPASIVTPVRDVVLAHDPNQPIDNVATLEELGSDSVAPRRLNAILLGAFALLALVIAAVGIGAVLAFSVGSRTREFGIKSALGAARHQVWSGVLVEGATLAAAGVVLGSAVAIGLARFIAELLVGVPALDPVTFVAVGLLLSGVAVGAAWVPAWRAAEVSPMEALAAE